MKKDGVMITGSQLAMRKNKKDEEGLSYKYKTFDTFIIWIPSKSVTARLLNIYYINTV